MHKELVRIWWCRDMSDLIQSHHHPSKMSKSVFVWLEPISSPASLPWPSLPSLTSPAADSAPRMTRMIFALTKCYITLKKSQANWDYAMRKMHCRGSIDKTKLTRMHLLLYVWPWCVQPALWKRMNDICTKNKGAHLIWLGVKNIFPDPLTWIMPSVVKEFLLTFVNSFLDFFHQQVFAPQFTICVPGKH